MFNVYRKLWDLILLRERKKGIFLIISMIFFGIIETFGIVSIFPLVSVISNPKIIETNEYLNFFFNYFNFQSTNKFLILLTSIVFLVIVTRTVFNGFLNHFILRFTQFINQSLSYRLLSSYLQRPYVYFLTRNSAEMGKSILSEVEEVSMGSLVPALELLSRVILSTFILFALFLVDPFIASISIFTFSLSYGIIYFLIRQYLLKKAIERIEANKNRFLISKEALVGIKEIKVRDATDIYLKNFSNASKTFHQIRVKTSLAKLIPNLFIQISASGGILIFILILLTKNEGNYTEIIPFVSLYAYAGLRVMPVVQGIFKNLTSIRSSKPALKIIHTEIIKNKSLKKDKKSKIIKSLRKEICIENITFSYPESKSPVIKDLSLNIKAKSCVAFVGSTGSGKSTTIDLILGLLEPQKGSIRIDDITLKKSNIKSWQSLIGYVPQSIFITDDTIAKNIALGSEEGAIDYEKVRTAAKMANIDKFITNELPLQYFTKVGEAGVKLSGGQRQRIGIARALYRDPEILIFDEATSSLDNLTENQVMNSISKLKNSITIILIAHRLSTIKECDLIYHLNEGKLRSEGTFKELSVKDKLFKNMASKIL
tara:strand:+ start:1402 stop:3198 length:1797 start_codon:yes stop_codon:yes gene_type:complete